MTPSLSSCTLNFFITPVKLIFLWYCNTFFIVRPFILFYININIITATIVIIIIIYHYFFGVIIPKIERRKKRWYVTRCDKACTFCSAFTRTVGYSFQPAVSFLFFSLFHGFRGGLGETSHIISEDSKRTEYANMNKLYCSRTTHTKPKKLSSKNKHPHRKCQRSSFKAASCNEFLLTSVTWDALFVFYALPLPSHSPSLFETLFSVALCFLELFSCSTNLTLCRTVVCTEDLKLCQDSRLDYSPAIIVRNHGTKYLKKQRTEARTQTCLSKWIHRVTTQEDNRRHVAFIQYWSFVWAKHA